MSAVERPSEVSISVFDRREAGVWKRGESTIQIEGGSYPVVGAIEVLEAVGQAVRLAHPPTGMSEGEPMQPAG